MVKSLQSASKTASNGLCRSWILFNVFFVKLFPDLQSHFDVKHLYIAYLRAKVINSLQNGLLNSLQQPLEIRYPVQWIPNKILPLFDGKHFYIDHIKQKLVNSLQMASKQPQMATLVLGPCSMDFW